MWLVVAGFAVASAIMVAFEWTNHFFVPRIFEKKKKEAVTIGSE